MRLVLTVIVIWLLSLAVLFMASRHDYNHLMPIASLLFYLDLIVGGALLLIFLLVKLL